MRKSVRQLEATQPETQGTRASLFGGSAPKAPGIFRVRAIPCFKGNRRERGVLAPTYGLAPESALELLPSRALSSAQANTSLAESQLANRNPGGLRPLPVGNRAVISVGDQKAKPDKPRANKTGQLDLLTTRYGIPRNFEGAHDSHIQRPYSGYRNCRRV